ncbi:MAG: transglycosylase domain-containing protein, partial [Candidatus Dormiibacterota bacterium]
VAAASRGGVSAAAAFQRATAAVGHQVQASRQSRPSGRVLRDSRGRRLRASAYTGPRLRAPRKGGDLPTGTAGRWIPFFAKVALVAIICVGAFLGSSQGYINYAADLPDAHQLTAVPQPSDTLIYAADGSLMADLHPNGVAHYQQPLTQMGKWLPEATVAIEDANFWNEPGIDPVRIVSAALTDWRSQSTQQGASTITQQIVKLDLLKNSDQTLDRKIKEAILAIQVEHTYSKSQILEMYLNSVDYGNNAQGTQAAAQNYFRVNADQLSLAQATLLAGVPRNPTLYAPSISYPEAKYRQQQVLNAMVKQKMITRQEATQAYAVNLLPQLQTIGTSILQNPDYIDYVVSEVATRMGISVGQVEGAGYRVYTPYQPAINAIAQSDVTKEAQTAAHMSIQQGAMTALDPATGGIISMVGSATPYDSGQYDSQLNWALAPRHPGSSFKIFNYTAAIASGKLTMTTKIPDGPASYAPDPTWHLTNYDGSFLQCVLEVCFASSENIPAVFTELAQPGGVASVVDEARNLGASVWNSHQNADGTYAFTTNDPADTFGPTLTVGGYDETTLDMAQGAATLADMGVYHPATSITKITSAEGTALYQLNPAAVARQAVSPQVAYIMNQILSNIQNKIPGFGPTAQNLVIPGRTIAAKTGTAENWTDSWTIGWTPALASAFWFGNLDENIGTGGADAVLIASPAWQAFMTSALNTMNAPPNQWYAEPAGLTNGSSPTGPVYYLPGTSAGTPTPPMPPGLSIGAPTTTKPKTPAPPKKTG